MASGHCLCGRIRFVTDGEPQWVAYCHCGFCRRHTASPVACFVNYRARARALRGHAREL